MENISKIEKILSLKDEFSNKNSQDLKLIKARIAILNKQTFEVDKSKLEIFLENKINIVKIHKTNIKKLEKVLVYHNNGKYAKNQKLVKQSEIIISKLNKFNAERKQFLIELKGLEDEYNKIYDTVIFASSNTDKESKIDNKEKPENIVDPSTIDYGNLGMKKKESKSKNSIISNKKNKKTVIFDNNIEKQPSIAKKTVVFDESINITNKNTKILDKSYKEGYSKSKNTIILDDNTIGPKRNNVRAKTRKINKTLIDIKDNKFEIDDELYYDKKAKEEHSNNTKFLLSINNILCPPYCFRFYKVIVFFTDEDFNKINNKYYSFIHKFKENYYKYNIDIGGSLKYEMEFDSSFDNLYAFIIILGVNMFNNRVVNSNCIVGFSLFQVNKISTIENIKIGNFQLPVYEPSYLKMDNKEFANIYKNNKLTRLLGTSILITNIEDTNDFEILEYNSKTYINNDYTISEFEKAILTVMHKKSNKCFSKKENYILEISNDIKSKIKLNYYNDINDKYDYTILDKDLQLYNCSVNNLLMNFYVISEKFSLDFKVKAIVLPNPKYFYKCKAVYMALDEDGKIIKNKTIFKKLGKNSNNNMFLFDENYHEFNCVCTNIDFIIIKVYYCFYDPDDRIIENEYGSSIIPVFINAKFSYNGDFIIPIIMNNYEKKALDFIIDISPNIFINNLANGFYSEAVKFRKGHLIVSLKEHLNPIYDKSYNDINFYSINFIFMPIIFNNIYLNLKQRIESGNNEKNDFLIKQLNL